MALLSELRSLFNDSDLRNRVTAATVLAASAELAAVPGSVKNRAWALDVLGNRTGWGEMMFVAILADNASLTVAQIRGATDATIQAAVNGRVESMATAKAGL